MRPELLEAKLFCTIFVQCALMLRVPWCLASVSQLSLLRHPYSPNFLSFGPTATIQLIKNSSYWIKLMASDPHKNKLGIIFNNFTWWSDTKKERKKSQTTIQVQSVSIDFPNWNSEATVENIKELPTNRKLIVRKLWHVL